MRCYPKFKGAIQIFFRKEVSFFGRGKVRCITQLLVNKNHPNHPKTAQFRTAATLQLGNKQLLVRPKVKSYFG